MHPFHLPGGMVPGCSQVYSAFLEAKREIPRKLFGPFLSLLASERLWSLKIIQKPIANECFSTSGWFGPGGPSPSSAFCWSETLDSKEGLWTAFVASCIGKPRDLQNHTKNNRKWMPLFFRMVWSRASAIFLNDLPKRNARFRRTSFSPDFVISCSRRYRNHFFHTKTNMKWGFWFFAQRKSYWPR